MNTQIATQSDQKTDGIRKLMLANKDKIARAISSQLTPERLIQVACNSLAKNPKLLNCTPASLFRAVSEAGSYGWVIDGVLGSAYLVPYGTQAVLIPGYKGLMDLARRAGCQIMADVVREGDRFEWLGSFDRPQHYHDMSGSRNGKPLTHVYAVAKMQDGSFRSWFMSLADVLHHRDQFSQNWKRVANNPEKAKESMWHQDHPNFAKMARKTVVRQAIASGEIPLSVEDQLLARRDVDSDPLSVPVEIEEPALLESPEDAKPIPREATAADWEEFRRSLGDTDEILTVNEITESFVRDRQLDGDDIAAASEFRDERIAEIREGRGGSE